MPENLSSKQLRVFVSSTFKDMEPERSLMIGKIFPMVADYCHRRKVEFVGVDLLWGVSEEQSMRGETIPICMAEIDRSRPLFIGMIGQRYGWIPDDSDISVTEMEIRYGALEAPENTEAFFYLRDQAYTRELYGPFEKNEKLDDLKRRIRESGYPFMDGYRDLESFGQRVYEDLTGAADRLISRNSALDPVEEERENQRFTAERYAANVIDRPGFAERMDELVTRGGLILVTGESGMGKTALTAKWALTSCSREEVYTFLYFIGSSSGKGWEQPGRQLVDELKKRFSLDYPAPESKEDLRRAIHIVLNMAAKHGQIVLVMDQIDALTLDDAFGLSWLPEELPENVSVILTLNDGKALDLLRRRHHEEVQISRLSADEVELITVKYLAMHSKTLGNKQIALLRGSENARYPLYLKTVLDEIRHVGRYDTLTEQTSDYLSCAGIPELFDKVLSRFDRDLDPDYNSLPERMLSLIEASRDGLTEGELIPLLSDLPQAKFAPLRLALESFTAVSSSAIHIAVPAFRTAVRQHYGINETKLAEYRSELIRWFTNHPDTPRRSYVLPWLLMESGDMQALTEQLSVPDCFGELWHRNKYETKAYWTAIRESGTAPAEAYREILASPGNRDGSLLYDLGELFTELGDTDQAETLLSALVDQQSDADDHRKGLAYGLLGNIYQREGRFTDAERCYKQKYACAYKTGDRYEQQRAQGNIGMIALSLGHLQTARKAFENVLSLALSLNQRDSQQVALGNLGNIAFAEEDYVKAETLFKRQKDISLDTGNTAGVINACGALGILYLKLGRLDQAEPEFSEQEKLSRRIGAADGLANALGNRAALAYRSGNRDHAEELFREKLDLCRKTGQFAGEQNALGNLALITAEKGDLPTALDYAEKRAALTKAHQAFRQYIESLISLAAIKERLGRSDEAKNHRLLAQVIARQHGIGNDYN